MIPATPIISIAISWISATSAICPYVLPSDADALSRLLPNLDNARSSFESRFEFATVLVVIGVFAEVLVVLWEFRKETREYREDFKLWKQNESGPPHRPSLGIVIVALIAAIFVFAGVAGEWWYEIQIGAVDTCIRRVDNARATLLQQQAGDAAKSAKQAQESANAANRVAGEAELKADAVGRKAKALDDRMNSASVKLDRLEGRLAWRTISPKKFKKYKAALIRFPHSVVGISIWGTNDQETSAFALSIEKLLHDSQWDVRIINAIGIPSPPRYGVDGRVDERTEAGRALAGVLKGLPGATVSNVPFSNGVAHIIIGQRIPHP